MSLRLCCKVHVTDAVGRTRVVSQPFSLDGTRMNFNLLPRLALMCNISTVVSFQFVAIDYSRALIILSILLTLFFLVLVSDIFRRFVGSVCCAPMFD